MRTYPAFLTFAATAATGLMLCGGVRADPAQTLTIDNHQKLVTVKDATGAYLFAQVLPSPNLNIVAAPRGKGLSRLSLQDGAGRTIWAMQYGGSLGAVDVEGDWNSADALGTLGTQFDRAAKSIGLPSPIPSRLRVGMIEMTISPADQLVSVQARADGRRVVITPLKTGNGFTARVDRDKVLVVILPPQTPTPGAASVAQTSTP